MNRRNVLSMGAAASALATLALAQTAQPVLRWCLTSSYSTSLDAIYGAGEVFARLVNELTDDRFQIRVFAAGELVPPLQAADVVQSGTLEAAHTSSFFYTGKIEAFAFGTGMPFGMNTRQQNAWMYEGSGIEAMNELYRSITFMACRWARPRRRWVAGSGRRSRRLRIFAA